MTIIVDPDHDTLNPGTVAPSGSLGAARSWCLGSWYIGNYPAVVTFHEDRLVFAGAPQLPQRIDASCTSQYTVFSPSALLDATVAANNAYGINLNANTINAIRWLQSDSHGLLIGTAGNEWLLAPATIGQAISSTNATAQQSSLYGSVPVAPLRVGQECVFMQAGGKRMRSLKYDFYTNGFIGPDVSVLAEHLTAGGIVQLMLQKTPQQIVWALRADGTLLSISYDRDQDEEGWAAHAIGGQNAKVLSIATIPTPDNSRDELWLAVQRTINGSTVCYIERMTKLWEAGDSTPYSLNGATAYRFVPNNTYYLDSSVRTVFGSPVTTITGLTWLEGQTVSVLADSATHPDVVVTGGSITLQRSARDVNIGLNYTSRSQTMPLEAGGQEGPAQGKIKRIHRIIMRMYDTLGLQVQAGSAGAIVNDEAFRSTSDLMDQPPPLFNGNFPITWEGSYDRDGYVIWEQTQPLPSNISGLSIELETQDGG